MSDVDETVKMGPSAILKIIRQLKPIAGDICPNIEKLCFTAITLPLSTAEVERVFSDVNRTVTDERNRLIGQHCGSPWHLLAPISYNCYTSTFPLIPSDDDKIRPTCTQSCVWNDQINRLISYTERSI